MRRALALSLPALLCATLTVQGGAAWAGEAKKPAEDQQYVDIATVALPIVWQGRLVNYVFTDVRVDLTPHADAMKLRAKEPFLRDALVRAGHARPFVRPWDFTHVDDKALAQALRPAAERILGPGAVKGVEVKQQTARQQTGLPQKPKPEASAPAEAAPPL